MQPIVRICAALSLIGLCQTAPAEAAGTPGHAAMGIRAGPISRPMLAQSEEERRRRQEEEIRVKRRQREMRREREMEERKRALRRERDRQIRLERETRELRERAEKERELRERRIRGAFETTEERRRRARRERRLNVVPRELLKRFPPNWVAGIMEGRVESGWSPEAVRESWGAPQRITRDATGLEIWHYPAGVVYFSNGVVSAVIDAQPAQKPPGNR